MRLTHLLKKKFRPAIVRWFLLAIATAAFASTTAAQGGFTTVTGTITDPNGVKWSCGTIAAQLITAGGAAPTLNGGGFTTTTAPVQLGCPTIPGSGAAGSFAMRIADSGVIVPSNTTWQFTVNISGGSPPIGTGPQSFIYTSAINCGTNTPSTCTSNQLDISTQLSALAPKLSNITTTSSVSSIPGTPGVTAVPVQSGLLAEYRILAGETCGALIDYSGKGNNATGSVGTAPTVNAITGGIAGNNAGACSLPAALNSAQTVQLFIGNANGNTNGALVVGNGNVLSSSILALNVVASPSATQALTDGAFAAGSRIYSGWMQTGNNFTFYPRAMVEGNIDVAWVHICDAAHSSNDTIYINGVDQGDTTIADNQFLSQRCSQGHQTTGNYQLGGIAGASCPNWGNCGFMNNGNIYYALFYNRPLNKAEVAANSAYLKSAMIARGVTPTIFQKVPVPAPGTLTVNTQLAVDGDSLSCGACAGATPTITSPYSTYLTLNNLAGGVWNITNMGRAGYRLDFNLLPYAAQAVDPIFQPNSTANAVVIWGGTNDGTASASTVAELSSYCQQRHAVGWKCIVATMISRTGLDAAKNNYNAAIRQLWPTFADALADLAADVSLGADAANASAVYFTTDNIHVRDTGIINDETPIIQRAVNRLYGNHDFSTAATYSSAAAAAVATTALSESGNTVTVTMAATPANCQVGNLAVVAGVTAAGYNSTAANGAGNGAWLIRTRSATQITYFDATTGLGAATVQGTVVCAQRQDADQYAVLNFGAGNHTLDSCVGYTGQLLYTKNINAGSSTVVPFGTETIDGAANVTIATRATLILQSILTSASAAGCSWKQLQNN